MENGPSHLWPEERFFSECAGILAGNSNALVQYPSVVRRLIAFPGKEVGIKIRSTSPRTITPGEGRSSGASEGKPERVRRKNKRELLSGSASRSQYMACQPAASVSRLGERSGRLPPPRKMVVIGDASAQAEP
jgi:hypothetical protein